MKNYVSTIHLVFLVSLIAISNGTVSAAPQEPTKPAPTAPAKERPTNEPGTAETSDDKKVQKKTEGATAGATAGAADWAQWRGPERTGVLPAQNWPDKLQDNLKKKWSVKMAPSYSGPLVVGDHVYSTETVGKKNEVVRCFKRSDGSEVWSTQWQGSMRVPFFANANGSWIRATPTYDSGKLYVVGILDVLKCLDAKTGDEVWSIDFVGQYNVSKPAFGAVTSPMIDGDFLYTQAANSFFKINKKTGEVVWQSLKGEDSMMSGGSFSSPVIAKVAGKRQAVVATRTALAGVDLKSGEQLWNQPIKNYRGMNILTPLVYKGKVFSSAYNGLTQMFDVSTATPAQAVEKWNHGAKAYMSTPVIVDGHLYMFLQNRRFSCINLETGQETYRTSERFGKYASMIVSGKKILALDENGTLMLIKANPETFELIDKVKVSDNSWAHLAISGDEVVIRELNALTTYTWKE